MILKIVGGVITKPGPDILFVYPSYENLGIQWLSAVLKKQGYSVGLAFDPVLFDDDFITIKPLSALFSQRKALLARIEAQAPKIVAFSVVTDRFAWVLDLAGAIKSRIDTKIIIGGIHVTGAPETVLSHPEFDVGVRGEGEAVIGPLVKSLLEGRLDTKLPGLVYRQDSFVHVNPPAPLILDLDSLPFPDKELYANTSLDPKDMYTTLAGRGCPFACTFCNNSLVKCLYSGEKHLRFRSVENVIEELVEAKNKYNPAVINFLDEVFGAKPSWLLEFAKTYPEKVGIPFIGCTHPALESQNRVSLLVKAGCRKMDMGVQTLSDDLRKNVLERPETTDQVTDAIKRYKKAGITLFAENIIGLPGETDIHHREMVRFYNENRPAGIKVFWLRYYPGTAIVDIAYKMGVLDAQDLDQIKNGTHGHSIAQGGAKSDRSARQVYLLLKLLPILPRKWVTRIEKRRWYRFFPTFLVERFAYLAGRLLTKQDSVSEVLMGRAIKHYQFYLLRAFRVARRSKDF